MSVFASSLPAWRFIDPIAMLSAYRSSKMTLDEGLEDLLVRRDQAERCQNARASAVQPLQLPNLRLSEFPNLWILRMWNFGPFPLDLRFLC